MSNHFTGLSLGPPLGDPRLDLCDLYAFQSPADPTRTAIILNANVNVDALFVAAGFSGTGFKTAPAVGASMAELILTGKSTTVDLSPFGFERILSGRMIESANEYEMGASFGHKL